MQTDAAPVLDSEKQIKEARAEAMDLDEGEGAGKSSATEQGDGEVKEMVGVKAGMGGCALCPMVQIGRHQEFHSGVITEGEGCHVCCVCWVEVSLLAGHVVLGAALSRDFDP